MGSELVFKIVHSVYRSVQGERIPKFRSHNLKSIVSFKFKLGAWNSCSIFLIYAGA